MYIKTYPLTIAPSGTGKQDGFTDLTNEDQKLYDAINNHLHTGLDGSLLSAVNINNAPAGNITSTNQQAVNNELDTKKANANNSNLTGITTIAGQLQYPAVQNPSSDPNCNDDYEEGNWTPTPTSLTVVGTPSISGTYTKIGNRVFCNLSISASTSTASAQNSTCFTGLPYAVAQRSTGNVTSTQTDTIGMVLVETNNTVYMPYWSATAKAMVVSFQYRS